MGETFDRMTLFSTLLESFDRVEENQGCAGVDGVTIEDFSLDLDGNLALLRHDLIRDEYRPSPLLRTYMKKDDGGQRPLSIPTVRDRVVHTAAALVLTPILEPEFEDCSFAYRPGRSVNSAVRRILALRDTGYRWVVDADIDEYFAEIPHGPLMDILGRHVTDPRILRLVDAWLRAEVRENGESWVMNKGVAQGSPLSPLLSNLYLDAFDEDLGRKGHKLVRYADDFVVLCRTQPSAQAALELTREALDDLHLRLNQEDTAITHFDAGFHFLGVQFLRGLAFRPIESGSDNAAAELATNLPSRAPRVGEKRSQSVQTRFGMALSEALRNKAGIPQVPPKALDKGIAVAAPSEPAEGPTPPAPYDPILRTLHIVEQGAELARESRRLVVAKGDRILAEIPALKVDQIVLSGNVQVTTSALRLCMRQEIPIFFVSMHGNLYGAVDPMVPSRALLHRRQFECSADQAFCLKVSREIVRGKLANCRTLLLRLQRRGEKDAFKKAAKSLAQGITSLDAADSLDSLRGVEGSAAAAYFAVWRRLLDKEWRFEGRRRQPPPDPINCLLSYGYTLLFANVFSLLRTQGLLPHIGFYHTLRRGHPALVSDLMEEFRAPLVDATVLTLVRKGYVRPEDFEEANDRDRPVSIGPAARKRLIQAFETALNRRIQHPDVADSCDYRRAISLQVRRLKECIQNGTAAYHPWRTR